MWLLIAISAYFLNAIAMVVDKTLLKKDIPHPFVYVFYIAALGAILMLLVLPFGFAIPNAITIFVSLVAGAVFVWALILLFSALKKDEATRVGPMIGGLAPIFVLILAWYILQESLTCNQYIGFIFLIIGAFLISLDFQKHGAFVWIKKKLKLDTKTQLPKIRKTLWIALPSAILFGVSHILTKFVYQNTEFLTGFIWTRAGSLLAVLILLLIPTNRLLIFKDLRKNKKQKNNAQKTGKRFLFGQGCGATGAILIQYAIFLGSVTLVNALQGLQQVFIFIIVLLLTLLAPKILKEKISKEIFFQKILAVALIFIGLYFVAI
ncbi:DMT family transporter [Candidatus Parcubacteria bacterium]|nr:DMT family transporter [Patescibacteria group bacterium]MCG2687130.1 DMT family transporter [Candidatus Parcubacteria bacterium]